MKKEPAIVKQLREEEKNGKLKIDIEKNCCYDKTNKDFFRYAIDNSADSVFLIDRKKMCFIDVNRTACESTGYSKDELLGMGPQHIKPEFSKRELASKFDSILKYDDSGVVETVHQRKDGSTFPVEVFLTCLQDDDVIVASVRDISDRKKVEKKIKESKKRFQTIFDSVNDAIFIHGFKGNFVEVNKAACKSLGYSREELLRMSPKDIDTSDSAALVEKRISKLKEQGEVIFEAYHLTKEGYQFPVELNAKIIDYFGKSMILSAARDITDRKKFEKKLSEQKNKYTTLVEQSNDGIAIVQNKKFKFANKTLEKITGFSSAEINEMDFLKCVVESEKEKIKTRYQKRMNGEPVPSFYETKIKCKNDGVKPVEISANIINYESKPAILAVIRDISERKEIEQRLKKRLNYEKTLQKISRVLLKETDVDKAVEQSLKFLLNLSEVSRVYFFKNFNDLNDGLCMKQIYEVCSEGVPAEIDNPDLQHVPYHPSFRRWFDFLSKNKPIYGLVKTFPESERKILEPQKIKSMIVLPVFVHSEFYGFIGFDDISYERSWSKEDIYLLQTAAESISSYIGRKKIEKELMKSKEKFKSYVDSSPEGIFVANSNGKYIDINQAACELTGFSKNELLEKKLIDLIADEYKEKAEKSFCEIKNKGKTKVDLAFNKKNGEKRFWTVHAVKLSDERFLGFTQDITKQKENEKKMNEAQRVLTLVNKELERKVEVKTAELKKAQKQLEETNKNLEERVDERTEEVKQLLQEKNAFINQLSHDLKNPIGPIVNLLPLVIEEANNPELLEILEVVNRNAVYMKNLIMDTLELARLEGSDKGFEYNSIGLSYIVEEVIKDNDFYFKDKNFEIENNINDDFLVFADEIRIKEVFNNIFSNALKYNKKETGKIKINAEKQDDFVKVSIKDTGMGMTPEQAAHIFDEFYKADPSRHDMVSSGLGLTICKRIIKKHGGEIWAESPGIGKGTIINFTLPIKKKN